MLKLAKPKRIETLDTFRVDNVNDYLFQRKYDGIRAVYDVAAGKWFQKSGLEMDLDISFDGIDLSGILLIDCELLPSGKLVAFDVVTDVPTDGLYDRWERLKRLHTHIYVVAQEEPTDAQARLYDTLSVAPQYTMDKYEGYAKSISDWEGIVIRKISAPYGHGIYKYKFTKRENFLVIGREPDTEQVKLGVTDGDETVDVGHIDGHYGLGSRLEVGDVVSVDFLYMTPNMRMVQGRKPELVIDGSKACELEYLRQFVKNPE